jgi:hypothetical protein
MEYYIYVSYFFPKIGKNSMKNELYFKILQLFCDFIQFNVNFVASQSIYSFLWRNEAITLLKSKNN